MARYKVKMSTEYTIIATSEEGAQSEVMDMIKLSNERDHDFEVSALPKSKLYDVTFELNHYPGTTLSTQELVDQLIQILPKEWWWGSHYADWGVVQISKGDF